MSEFKTDISPTSGLPPAAEQVRHLRYAAPTPDFTYYQEARQPSSFRGTLRLEDGKACTCSCGGDPLSIYFNPWAASGELMEVLKCTRCTAVAELRNEPELSEA